VVDSDTLLESSLKGLRQEYEDPSNSVGWCSEEGGWLLPTMDSYDLLGDLGLGNFYDDAATCFFGSRLGGTRSLRRSGVGMATFALVKILSLREA